MTDTTSASFLPRPLRVMAGRALEQALARAVALDPVSAERIAALEGRRVELHLRGPDLALAVRVQDGRLRVGQVSSQDTSGAALRVSASPGSLLAMALRRGDTDVAPGQVEIAGDAELARRLQTLARDFSPDIEEGFTQVFGDVIGVPLARAVNRVLAHGRRSVSHLAEDGVDWLREESRLSVARGELETFLDDVDAVRERSERLQARIARLERATGGSDT